MNRFSQVLKTFGFFKISPKIMTTYNNKMQQEAAPLFPAERQGNALLVYDGLPLKSSAGKISIPASAESNGDSQAPTFKRG